MTMLRDWPVQWSDYWEVHRISPIHLTESWNLLKISNLQASQSLHQVRNHALFLNICLVFNFSDKIFSSSMVCTPQCTGLFIFLKYVSKI